MRPSVNIIVAIDRRGAIGIGGDLVYRFKEDLRHFKTATMGSTVVMGVLYQGGLYYASVGDSFLYLLREGNLVYYFTIPQGEDLTACAGLLLGRSAEALPRS